MVMCMMATNVRALQTVSFLLMLAITVNARVVSEQVRGQEDNGEMSREFFKQGHIGDGDIDQIKKEILALLLNDQETKAQAPSQLQSLFEEDLDIKKEEMDPEYRPTSKPEEAQAQDGMYNPDLFEGDLKISDKQIKAAYGKSSDAELQKATSDVNKLWELGYVYYDLDESVDYHTRTVIRSAMDEYEQHTCLRFYLRSPTFTWITQFIHFQSSDRGCYSTSVGQALSMQTINLDSIGCATHSTVLHEIGHAIGFWHEQSRPDRDNYVTINWDNIKAGKEHNFNLRHKVDYQDEEYDYASIMHYPLYAFTKFYQKTLSINNFEKLIEQGFPNVGHGEHLSPGDIRQVNKLYDCYNPSGYWGRLRVHVHKATGLPSGTYYADVVAIYTYGTTGYGVQSFPSTKSSNNYPADYTWTYVHTTANQKNWRYLRIWITNEERDTVISRQTIWIKTSGVKVEDSYCLKDEQDVERMKCVYFNYEIV